MTHGNPATNTAHQAAADLLTVAGPDAEEADRKALASMRARAARGGWTLSTFTEPDGRRSYCLSKWGRPVVLPDLAAVAQHLCRVGAPE